MAFAPEKCLFTGKWRQSACGGTASPKASAIRAKRKQSLPVSKVPVWMPVRFSLAGKGHGVIFQMVAQGRLNQVLCNQYQPSRVATATVHQKTANFPARQIASMATPNRARLAVTFLTGASRCLWWGATSPRPCFFETETRRTKSVHTQCNGSLTRRFTGPKTQL